MTLPPGPLNGAPIGGNQGSGSGTPGGPPAILQGGPATSNIPQGASVNVSWQGSNLSDVAAVETREVPGGASTAPSVNSFAFVDPDPGVEAEVIIVDLDTSGISGVFMVIFRDSAGREAVGIGQVTAA